MMERTNRKLSGKNEEYSARGVRSETVSGAGREIMTRDSADGLEESRLEG